MKLSSSKLRTAWSVVALDVGWFACVLGAAWRVHWLGAFVVSLLWAVNILTSEKDAMVSQIALGLACLLIGFGMDTILISIGTYEPNRWLLPHPLTTVWLLMLWLNFSLALPGSLKWFQGHLFFAAIAGSVFGPLAYLAASRLGAIRIEPPISGRLFLISFGWLIAMPLISATARKLHRSSYRLRKRQCPTNHSEPLR